ncbi:unnamed protein product [Mytilus coruscus]|uniref:Uncharacterized protein n=1 Tax=Mytilus coruscus TaxID=42192 RepID=A0A6J8BA90_MYTCO|nr:unnamed protein product [Mytilus coruscus]
MMNTVIYNLYSHKTWTLITSGSFGEGLQMRGSDLDLTAVLKRIEVCEDTNIHFNADKIYFTMELEDTELGFTKLRLVHGNNWEILKDCTDIGGDFYFSNLSLKQRFSIDIFSTVHGPCVIDEDGLYDIMCLHCKSWITPAKQWETQSKNSWPRYDVKQAIVKHGVLFVPLGFVFIENLQPDELQILKENYFPPIVYAHFLRLVCHFHLKSSRQCWDSLRDLQLAIEENYCIADRCRRSVSYNIMGIGFQMLGDIDSARQAFMHSIKLFLDQKINRAFQQLSLFS